MKLSFSLPSKPSSKSTPKPSQTFNDEDRQEDNSTKQFVTEFDPSKSLIDSKPHHVIPPKENEWKPFKRMKNLRNLPVIQSDGSRELQFETESLSVDLGDGKVSYGLNLRQSTKTDASADEASKTHESGGNDGGRPRTVDNILLDKLKDDLERLPEHLGLEEFTDMPVEGFGAALLAGYGWREGRGIGKNTKEDVKVKQISKRTSKEGVGFVAPSHDKEKETERDTKKKDKDKGGFNVGKDVRVIAGRDVGSKGRILEKLSADLVVLRLSRSEEEVRVRVNDIADLGSKEEERCLRKLKEEKIENSNRESSKHRGSEKRASKRSREHGNQKRGGEEVKIERRERGGSWLTSHIRVRIISKDLNGGRLYLKKGEVVDVVGPYMCDITMDESKELVQGVDQEFLETALPRRGGHVLVLSGKHKGVYGSLVERDLDQETGVVRDADTHDLLNVHLEQIAEYIGDPSLLGY
ncbi:MOS2 putative isoform 1 [Tripterygium wilfordii]|uniref:MOS2 putative isoform 1 n=1 Tax=Tripterygium wilfordii TaxID=458696 RepID=A0A7J7BW54_TRIWF|nr:protein MOS2-like [Tripterygium wilfordii]XP_038695250.1 protein MOS2-like [Tripterygium wilfordii]XP_038695251.1 protein MOS2-like [Tripterygium wilfordii]XP_038695252.1 protein MOS2-like [Tripterygium wilfordii]XP_038695253.1 protein MOS2-like [Tripterygium wilfordii]XP_038695255.1 protein MOS2-like [Tripterygium wilfordii]XP_038695256.1 protein MOS2-like [Tripterygium wilfordii]XP_038695257.1 protein MOS2-like [Tripterygium wilfordii]XP_038695258.1 protein MOS2-like [Tripterygium wilf